MSQAADLSGSEGFANHSQDRKDSSHQQPVQCPCRVFAQKIHCRTKLKAAGNHPAFIQGASSIVSAVEQEATLLYVKRKKEQPKDRELQKHEETHTSKGNLALFSLFRIKGQVCICFIPSEKGLGLC